MKLGSLRSLRGPLAAVLATGCVLAVAAAAQAKPGDLYVGDAGNSSVVRVTQKGKQHLVAAGGDLISPDGGAFEKNGKLLIADYNGLGGGAIFEVTPGTGAVHTVSGDSDFAGPTDVAVAPSGAVYAADPFAGLGGLGAIFKIGPTDEATNISDGQNFSGGPLGIKVLHTSQIVVSDQDAGLGGLAAIIGVDPDSGDQALLAQGGGGGGYGMTVGPGERFAYFADDSADAIQRADVRTGAVKTVASGGAISGPTGVAVGPDGAIYIANGGDNNVVRVAPGKHTGKVLAKNGLLSSPEGIEIEPPRCAGKTATIVGSTEADKLKGSPFPDVISGLGGRDRISGLNGKDIICGGSGDDKLNGGKGKDKLIGGKGRDQIRK